ncbi:MAG: hypothetical protein IJM92_00635 [Fibrobacter sp.]|uniref:hypothetical protein n=1 Tax=Fibrobacter sp. TaxID=35828 RepID=UPI0025C6EE54|nr:hypothetical protein [Fibrobacter sp.]MBQ3715752.1 hypothetical protein [Fibrobacter sp.]MBQ7078180.1 hypothetical protein [Fibrobacter sp.]
MKFRDFLQKPFVAALCLNLLFLLLCLGIGGIHVGSLDDYFMSAIVTGAYGGEFDPHILFVNGAYAYFLKPFYMLFPSVGWYYIFQLVSVFAAFTVFTYFMLRQVSGRLGIALSVFVLACLASDLYMNVAFTQCAAAATAAAIVLFYFGNSERHRLWLVAGGVFFVVGIVFRKEGFLLGMPFLVAVLALNVVETRKLLKTTAVVLLLCVSAYQGLLAFNNRLFENNEYTYYRDYQWSRSTFGDGANYDVDAVVDELDERQMQSRDFRYMQSWIFHDTQVLSLDSLKPFVNVVNRNRYEVNAVRMPAALFLVLAGSFFKTNAWCWVVLCFAFFFFAPRRANWYAWGALALICLCLGYLLYVNRVVSHVESGIWLYAIVSAIPMMKAKDFVVDKRLNKLPYLIVVLALGALVMAFSSERNISNVRMLFGTPQMSKDWSNLVHYMESRPDDVFLLYFSDYQYLAACRNPAYRAVAPRSWGNIIPVGYWNINLPGMKKEMAERGVDNPIRDLVKDNVYIMESDTLRKFERYYLVHYHQKVTRDTVASFGDMQLIKYRLDGGEQ